MKCSECGRELSGGLDTYGWPTLVCRDCYLRPAAVEPSQPSGTEPSRQAPQQAQEENRGLGPAGLERLACREAEHPDRRILRQGAVLQERYEIARTLHVGSQHTIYLARDLHFPSVTRLCVLKETVLNALAPDLRKIPTQLLERETAFLAHLSHPGIPKIFDFFTEVDRVCLVMEYIKGNDLQAILENTRGALSEATVLDWAIQICDILIYLHSQDPPIVYRDLKPAHVMLRGDQRTIVLIDFAAAAVYLAGQRGRIIVTEGYSAPEQYDGIADPRSDMYALGATLHHLLTRRDPRREAPFTFHDKPPRVLNPALSAATDAAIMQALEYDPAKRYPSAQAFKQALEAALNIHG